MPARERTCTAKNRVRELRSPGSVRDEGSDVLVYSDGSHVATVERRFNISAGDEWTQRNDGYKIF